MAPYAAFEVRLIGIIGGLLSALTLAFAGWWVLLPLILTAALLAFYRDPPRHPPKGDDIIVAPADGRIMSIGQTATPNPKGPIELKICIFLSVLDVHINRAPCAGRVLATDYRPGEFLNALKTEATDRNESNTLTIEPAPPLPGPIRVRQISGALARRIVCAADKGDKLQLGQRYGMIKLGSQTQVCLPTPARWEVLVSFGTRVHAGETILARLRPDG